MSKWMTYRRRGSAIDNSVVSQYVSRVQANGGTVSNSTIALLQAFVSNLQANGVWDRLTEVWPCCGDQLAAAVVKLKVAPATAGLYTNNNFVGGDYAESGGSGGLNSNGTTKYLAGGPLVSTLGLDGHLSAYAPASTAGGGNRALIGAINTNTQGVIFSAAPGTDMTTRIGTGNSAVFATASTAGYWISSRRSATALDLYLAGTGVASNAVSTSPDPDSLAMNLFCYNSNGTPSAFWSGRLAFATFGLGLSSPQASVLNSAVSSFNIALGR